MFEPPGSGKGSRMRMLLCGEEALGLKGAYEAALAAAGVPGELQVVSSWDEVCDQLQGQEDVWQRMRTETANEAVG